MYRGYRHEGPDNIDIGGDTGRPQIDQAFTLILGRPGIPGVAQVEDEVRDDLDDDKNTDTGHRGMEHPGGWWMAVGYRQMQEVED